MSVSQPLAADGTHGGAKSDRNQQGRGSRALDGTESKGPLPNLLDHHIRAPEHLTLDTRIEFRAAASSLIDRIPFGAGRLVVDCGSLKTIDSVGLNALILVRRRADARRIRVLLRALDVELRTLLVLTKLEDLFDLDDGLPH